MKLNMRIGTRILAGYALALLVVGTVGIIAYRSTTELVESADLVAHSHKVQEGISTVLSTLKDAETGQRGFVMTGEERYLEPYLVALKAVDKTLQDLRELTADNASQQRQLEAMRPFLSAKLGELAETVALRRQRGQEAALKVVLTDRGKNDMDQIRRIAGEMSDEADQVLALREQISKATARFAEEAIIVGGAVALTLMLVIGILTQRSITQPLATFMQFVARVGQGDLTHQAEFRVPMSWESSPSIWIRW